MAVQVLLDIQEGDVDVGRRSQQGAELVVQANLLAILQVLSSHILIHTASHISPRDLLIIGQVQERLQLGGHRLRLAETVVLGASLGLLASGVLNN